MLSGSAYVLHLRKLLKEQLERLERVSTSCEICVGTGTLRGCACEYCGGTGRAIRYVCLSVGEAQLNLHIVEGYLTARQEEKERPVAMRLEAGCLKENERGDEEVLDKMHRGSINKGKVEGEWWVVQIRVPEDLHERAQAVALLNEQTYGELFSQWIRERLEQVEPEIGRKVAEARALLNGGTK